MRLLLDTTVLIDAARGTEPARSWLQDELWRPNVIGVCPVNITEFFAGLRPDERLRWDAFVGELAYWGITRRIAVQAGVYQFDYARRGHQIQLGDALVAATAVVVGAIIVTDNVKDFPMPEVTILRLREV
jgi:hypothetical protein